MAKTMSKPPAHYGDELIAFSTRELPGKHPTSPRDRGKTVRDTGTVLGISRPNARRESATGGEAKRISALPCITTAAPRIAPPVVRPLGHAPSLKSGPLEAQRLIAKVDMILAQPAARSRSRAGRRRERRSGALPLLMQRPSLPLLPQQLPKAGAVHGQGLLMLPRLLLMLLLPAPRRRRGGASGDEPRMGRRNKAPGRGGRRRGSKTAAPRPPKGATRGPTE